MSEKKLSAASYLPYLPAPRLARTFSEDVPDCRCSMHIDNPQHSTVVETFVEIGN